MSEQLLKYNKVFMEVFGIAETQLNSSLTYQSIDSWDSVGHMELIAKLESTFEIMIEMDDVIDFNSYEFGMKILNKYSINLL
jgi:acyl carrier protein